MPQVAGGSFHGGDALHIRRRLPREQWAGAVHSGVTQPAFGRGNQAGGDFHSVTASEFASGNAGFFAPGQREAAIGKFSGIGQVHKRRQQDSLLGGSGSGELRNEQHALLPDARFGRRQVVVRQRAVGGAEINPDGIMWHEESWWCDQANSTSAGATMRGSRASETAGMRTSRAIQP